MFSAAGDDDGGSEEEKERSDGYNVIREEKVMTKMTLGKI